MQAAICWIRACTNVNVKRGGAEFPDAESKGVVEIFDAMRDGKIKAAIVMADGLNHTAKQLGDVEAALGAVETLVVSSLFDNEITAKADIVFPPRRSLSRLLLRRIWNLVSSLYVRQASLDSKRWQGGSFSSDWQK